MDTQKKQKRQISVTGTIVSEKYKDNHYIICIFNDGQNTFELRGTFVVVSPFIAYTCYGDYDERGAFVCVNKVTEMRQCEMNMRTLRGLVPSTFAGSLYESINDGMSAEDVFKYNETYWFRNLGVTYNSGVKRHYFFFDLFNQVSKYYGHDSYIWTLCVDEIKDIMNKTTLQLCTERIGPHGSVVALATLEAMGIEISDLAKGAISQHERLLFDLNKNALYNDPTTYVKEGLDELIRQGVVGMHGGKCALTFVHKVVTAIDVLRKTKSVKLVDGPFLESDDDWTVLMASTLDMERFKELLETGDKYVIVGFYGDLWECASPKWGNVYEYYYDVIPTQKTWTENETLTPTKWSEKKKSKVITLEVSNVDAKIINDVVGRLGPRARVQFVSNSHLETNLVNQTLRKNKNGHEGEIVHLEPDGIISRCEKIRDKQGITKKRGIVRDKMDCHLAPGMVRVVTFKNGRNVTWIPGHHRAHIGYCTDKFHGDPVDHMVLLWDNKMQWSHFHTALHRAKKSVVVISNSPPQLPPTTYLTKSH
jgi:hypothetical protein